LRASLWTVRQGVAYGQTASGTPDRGGSVAPEETVGEVVLTLGMAFAIRDAEWLNTFGERVVERDANLAWFAEIFASERFGAGSNPGQPSGPVSIVTDDVAASCTYQEFRGTEQMNALKGSHVD
jgi:hypothetical protein